MCGWVEVTWTFADSFTSDEANPSLDGVGGKTGSNLEEVCGLWVEGRLRSVRVPDPYGGRVAKLGPLAMPLINSNSNVYWHGK